MLGKELFIPPPPPLNLLINEKNILKFMNSLSFSYKQSKIIVGISSAISFTNRYTCHWYILSLLIVSSGLWVLFLISVQTTEVSFNNSGRL